MYRSPAIMSLITTFLSPTIFCKSCFVKMETGDPVSIIALISCRTSFVPYRRVCNRRHLHAVLVALRLHLLPIFPRIPQYNLLFAFVLCCHDSSTSASSLFAAEGRFVATLLQMPYYFTKITSVIGGHAEIYVFHSEVRYPTSITFPEVSFFHGYNQFTFYG